MKARLPEGMGRGPGTVSYTHLTIVLRFAGGGAMLPLLSEREAGQLVQMLEDSENG